MKTELSKRENEVMELMAKGYSRQEIQKILHISFSTIRCHIANINSKYYANNKTLSVLKWLRDNDKFQNWELKNEDLCERELP